MATIKRLTNSGQKPEPTSSLKKVAPTKKAKVLSLPDGPSPSITKVTEATFLIYGENKIGKTSLCSQLPNPIFLMFEPGGKGLNITRVQCEDWNDFIGYIDLIVKSDKYDTVVIDPISLCYMACVDWVCNKHGVNDPMEVSWGNGWKAIEKEFIDQIRRISMTHRGVVFLGHPEQAEFEKRTGGKYHKIIPRMMKQARSFIEAFVDVIGFYGYYGDERYLTIEGSDQLDAGNRLKYCFKTISGEKIHSIPMGDSEEEAYENLIAAFQNKQETRCEPEDFAVVGEIKPKRIAKNGK